MYDKECCVKCIYAFPVGASARLLCKRFPSANALQTPPKDWCGEFKVNKKWEERCEALAKSEEVRDGKIAEKEEKRAVRKAAEVPQKEEEPEEGKEEESKDFNLDLMGNDSDISADTGESN